ncbi:MAG: GNAT family N-acetyltransferase [Proteobacteria bacterium]|nr:MAG: GNAT family N-acetyltransferase [Pseudomonadota bacterium]
MSLTIRPATAADVPLIRSLIQALADFEKLSHEMVATEEGLRKTLFEGRPVADVLIAEWEGKGVGFSLFFYSYSTFLAKPGIYLEDLFVIPEYRSKGIGKALLQKIAQIAEERGYGRVEWSCLDWNERALKFYRGLGAEPMSEWTVQRLTEDKYKRLARGEV